MPSSIDYIVHREKTLHHVLPKGATTLEHALVNAYDAQPLPRIIERLNDSETIPAELLDIRAAELNVDSWSIAWPESRKRYALSVTEYIQSKKGTLWAVRETLRMLGQGDAVVIERVAGRRWDDGARWNDGSLWGDEWATLAIRLSQQVNATRGHQIINAINKVKPVRCHLLYIDFKDNGMRWDDGNRWDANYTWEKIEA